MTDTTEQANAYQTFAEGELRKIADAMGMTFEELNAKSELDDPSMVALFEAAAEKQAEARAVARIAGFTELLTPVVIEAMGSAHTTTLSRQEYAGCFGEMAMAFAILLGEGISSFPFADDKSELLCATSALSIRGYQLSAQQHGIDFQGTLDRMTGRSPAEPEATSEQEDELEADTAHLD